MKQGTWNISHRFAIAVLLPIIAILFLSSQIIWDKFKVYKNMVEIQQFSKMSPLISDVIHELQKERGASFGYVGGAGAEFLEIIVAQHLATNEKLTLLLTSFKQKNRASFGPRLAEKIKFSQDLLLRLGETRAKINTANLSPSDVLDSYTRIISGLLAILNESSIIGKDERLLKLSVTHSLFIQLKEINGLERAFGTVGFGSGKFKATVYKKFITTITRQKLFYELLEQQISPAQLTFYNNTLALPAVDKVLKLRESAVNNATKNTAFTISAEHWFRAITDKINLLKKVEDRFSADFIAMAEVIQNEAKNVFLLTIALTVLLITVVATLGFNIIRKILRVLAEAKLVITKLADGNTDFEISALDRQDGFGDIFKALHLFKERSIALQNSEERFRRYFELGVVGMTVTSPDQKWLDFNDRLCEMLGYERHELEKLSWENITHPDELDWSRQKTSEIFAGKNDSYTAEKKYIRKDGSVMHGLLSVRCLRNEDGSVNHLVGLLQDISDNKEAAEQLLKLSRAVEQSPAVVMITDLKGNIEYTNPKFTEITGYSAAEVLGKNPSILKSGHTSAKEYKFLWETIANGREWRGELHNVKKNGELYWELASMSPIFNSTGEITSFLAVKEDITERKIVDESLSQVRQELETRVTERTQELSVAKVQAEKANMAKSEFLSSMSHELRTPMNAILGFGQLLEHNPAEPLSDWQSESVGHILTGGEHLLELINEILDLSKIEAGKVTVSLENLTLVKILEECAIIGLPIAEKYEVELVNQFNPEDTTVIRADYTRMKQVILNLLSNAAKYNRQGGKIFLRVTSGNDKFCRIEVADTGYGIPKNKQASLFEPFNRLGADTTEIEGTGIGLTITKKLLELMGGEIGYESDIDIGSTFWADIPMVSPEEMVGSAGPIDLSGDEKSNVFKEWDILTNSLREKGGKTMLYVEDNPANLTLMEKIVEQIDGLSIESAHTAELGIALAAKLAPDLIILDINLPGMDGYEALAKMRTIEALKNLPIVALSARAMPIDIKEGLNAGFDRYLTKPINIGEVIQMINGVLSLETADTLPEAE